MARRNRSFFAKRNKGKAADVLLHNLLTPSSKSKRSKSKSNYSSTSIGENVGASTIFYRLLLFISWGLCLFVSFWTLVSFGINETAEDWASTMEIQLVMTAIPISLHLIKFIFKTIKKGKKTKETKPITEEKDLESGGEISTAETIGEKPVLAEGFCKQCNKRTKTNLENKITSTQSTFKKNIFSIKGFFLTLFSLGLWVFVAILIDLIKAGGRYVINKFRCQCDLRANA